METIQIEELEAVKKLDFNICMQCGECTGSCPIFSRSKLNVRRIVREITYLFSSISVYPKIKIDEKTEVWDCTTCGTCSIRCPRDVKPMDVLIGLRGILVERGRVPSTIAEALEGIYKYGNPWGLSRSKRSEWAEDLKVNYASEEEPTELLYFVGCAASYDSRAQAIAKAFVNNLNKLEISFSILGNKENCCGNEVYSLGEVGLFEIIVEKNLEIFRKHGVNNIVTTSPHCFNAFKNRYGNHGFSVQHYTQFFADLIDKGKLKFSKRIDKKVTYQDPCYLGRHNDVFDEPRKIIESVPGVTFLEMNLSRRRSVCCEGGGGRMWYDVPEEGGRLAEDRVREALEVEADILAVACPFCLLTLEDAVKTTGNEGKIEVKDIMELVAEAL